MEYSPLTTEKIPVTRSSQSLPKLARNDVERSIRTNKKPRSQVPGDLPPAQTLP